jgi:hypothetical protein
MTIIKDMVPPKQFCCLGQFLRDKMAKKASFKLWIQCAIVVGLFYTGIGFGLFAVILIFSAIPFIGIDALLYLVFVIARVSIITGFFSGNALYIARVLKWEKMNKDKILI